MEELKLSIELLNFLMVLAEQARGAVVENSIHHTNQVQK